MSEYMVVIQETHTYELRVEAQDRTAAVRTAKAARKRGEGRRTSKKPLLAVPIASQVKDY